MIYQELSKVLSHLPNSAKCMSHRLSLAASFCSCLARSDSVAGSLTRSLDDSSASVSACDSLTESGTPAVLLRRGGEKMLMRAGWNEVFAASLSAFSLTLTRRFSAFCCDRKSEIFSRMRFRSENSENVKFVWGEKRGRA